MKLLSPLILAVFFIGCFTLIAASANAQEKKSIKGIVRNIDLEKNTVLLTTFDKEDIVLTITDRETLDKLARKKIEVGDAVNVKYVVRDGMNVVTYFRKPAGC